MTSTNKGNQKDTDEDTEASPSIGSKFAKAARGTLSQRLSIAMPVFFIGIVCLFIWAMIESFFT